MRHIISLKEQSKQELLDILNLALQLKEKRRQGELPNYLSEKTLIMLFQKTSTRTRLSFEAGMTELGGHGIFLDSKTTQFALTDYAHEMQAVMRYGSVLMIRSIKAADVETAASLNKIPVIDACSEKYHPCQALGDILTMIEDAGDIAKIKKIAWLGIENNVSNTLKLACAKLGIHISIISPEVDKNSFDEELNKQTNQTGNVLYTTNLKEGLKDAQYIHTDTWMNMEFFEKGKVKPEYKNEYERRIKVFKPFQLNIALLNKYAPDAKIMHCMPCHLGYEITKDAVEHKNSLIFDQAENRMHIQKAIILWLLDINVK